MTIKLGRSIIVLTSILGKFIYGGIIMDKEEILRRSREEHCDEMEAQIRDKAMKWTYLVLVLSAAVFAFIRETYGQQVMDLCATVSLSVFIGQIYCFIKTKDKYNFIMAVITFIISVFATVRFFMGH